ncbi:site-specific DNA-methyltransferase [Natronomonas gomsonensis]|uniref:DNA-methyltransferase n=1 Tax=Natronomonas gomsonensis TaxID=1046043 RepID=UPI0020CA423A|nr:site-specific DNA-methyltransferase [Natronomonas gomsonensis]MCY4731733.1 site-specific DNA-methyltransferase [Natronomonas gomsonensis]
MQTTHEVRIGDARELDLASESVELAVTSPPYPMVEMWDDSFAAQDDAVADALEADDGEAAFEAMHALLDEVWQGVADALVDGGIAAVNVGDATRRMDGRFRLFPNHARIIEGLSAAGLQQLPGIVWRKPTNSTNKFMGSGTLPTNAYATLEHEHVLLFRKGDTRQFPPKDADRYASAFFYEERNEWFSDCWKVRGTRQTRDSDDDARERSGAFPLEIPLRLVRMYSIRGDTVLDPFVGTGTTSLAALVAGRNSVGIERAPDLAEAFETRASNAPALSKRLAEERLQRHREFVADRNDRPKYEAEHYDTRVVTKKERNIELSTVAAVERANADPTRFRATHEPF